MKEHFKRFSARYLKPRRAQPSGASTIDSTTAWTPDQTPRTTADSSVGSRAVSSAGHTTNSTYSSTPNAVSSSPNLPSRDLWEKARQCLSENDRKIIHDHVGSISAGDVTVPNTLLEVAKEKQKICEDKRWNFEFGGRKIRLQNVADRVILWLDKFKTVVDVAINADPLHAGLPWAGIKFLLLVSVSERQKMNGLLLGLDRVLYIMARCRVYESLYPADSSLSIAGQNFESALTDLYVRILQFLAEAIRTYSKSTTVRAVKAFLTTEDIIKFEEDCQDLENRVDIEAQNCERHHSKANRKAFSELKNKLLGELRDLKNLKEPIYRIDIGVDYIWKNLDKTKRGNILCWASGIPYEDNHRAAADGRTEDTGEWIFKHPTYKLWQSSDNSMVLWLHGIPGAGKTKLVSRVIEQFITRPDNHSLAYFYCNRNEDARRDPVNILRSFVKQLSISRNEGAIQDALVKIYQQKSSTGFASAELNVDECEYLLHELSRGYSQTTLVLDALDECEEVGRKKLFKLFNRLIDQLPHLKILISSREDDDIKRNLEQKANVGIQATDNADDISKFVSERIDQSQGTRRTPLSEDLRQEIVQTLLQKSQGMFQWAALQIAEVLELELDHEIRERLGRLPDDLKEAYDEIYVKIQSAKGSKPTFAVRAFQWVMCAAKPLSVDDLVAAVCQDPEDDKTQPPFPDIDINYVLDACRNLLLVDPETHVCRLSHLSVREYFEKHKHWNARCTNGLVAKVCLSLLNDPDNWNLSLENEGSGHSHALAKFLLYARSAWPVHVKNHGDTDLDERLVKLLKQFLGSPNESSSAYRNWYNMCGGGMHYRQDYYFYHYLRLPFSVSELRPAFSSALAMALFGFDAALPGWWTTETVDIEQQNDAGNSLLVLAVIGDSLSAIEKLLEMGTEVNKQLHRSEYDSALTAAAS